MAVKNNTKKLLDDLVLGRYRIDQTKPAGAGGAATVYLAKDETLGRSCAIKVLHPKRTGDHKFLDTFLGEIERLKELRHQNIVNILDYDHSNPRRFYVMEFAEQGTLPEYLDRVAPSSEVLPNLLRGVLEGLRFIHRSRRLHFDIKPSNILFSSGVAKISDFGVCNELADRMNRTYVITTTKYTHPDLLQLMTSHNKRVPQKYLLGKFHFDLYSVGKSLQEVRPQLHRYHYRQLALLDELIARLLEHDPYGKENRYRDVDQVLKEVTKLDPLYLQPAGLSELAPAFVNTAPCRIPPSTNVGVSTRIRDLIDTPTLQRLRQLPQIEGASAVFPGATHTRFEHSIGTYQKAKEILNSLLADSRANFLLNKDDLAVGLISALLNDIGYYPLAYILEPIGNAWPLKRDEIKAHILKGECGKSHHAVSSAAAQLGLDRVLCLTSRQARTSMNQDRILHSVIHGTLGANRLDHLERDSLHCGVPYGRMGDVERLYASLVLHSGDWKVAISEKGLASAESFLLALSTMFSQVYWHHTVRSFTSMIKAGVATAVAELPSKTKLTELALYHPQRFVDTLCKHVSPEASSLILPISRPGQRRFYKRVFTMTQQRLPQDNDGGRVWDALHVRTRSGIPAAHNEIRKAIQSFCKHRVTKYDITYDLPDETSDRLDDIQVSYQKIDGSGGEFVSLTLISPFQNDLLTNFSKYVKKARIFVNPSVIEHLGRPDRAKLKERINDVLLGSA